MWEAASIWLSRTIAVVVIMVAPGLVGGLLDQRFGTTIAMPIGFGLGIIAGTSALVVLARKFTPPARGKPLPWDDDSEIEEHDLAAASPNGTDPDATLQSPPKQDSATDDFRSQASAGDKPA